VLILIGSAISIFVVSFKRKRNKVINWCSHRTHRFRRYKMEITGIWIDWNCIQINLAQVSQEQQYRDFSLIPRMKHFQKIFEKMLVTYVFWSVAMNAYTHAYIHACSECLYMHWVRYLSILIVCLKQKHNKLINWYSHRTSVVGRL